MIKASLSEIAKLLTITAKHDAIITGISHDTRTITAGNLYVAIPGEQFDGHHFVAEAFKKAAGAALVNLPIRETGLHKKRADLATSP